MGRDSRIQGKNLGVNLGRLVGEYLGFCAFLHSSTTHYLSCHEFSQMACQLVNLRRVTPCGRTRDDSVILRSRLRKRRRSMCQNNICYCNLVMQHTPSAETIALMCSRNGKSKNPSAHVTEQAKGLTHNQPSTLDLLATSTVTNGISSRGTFCSTDHESIKVSHSP